LKDINLVPKSYLLAGRRKIKRLGTIIGVITGSIIIAACVIIPLFYKYSLQKQLDTINNGIEETTGYKTAEQKFKEILKRYSDRESIANGLDGKGLSAVTLLEKIEKGVPEKLFITKLNVGSENENKVRITLTGISATEDDIASFVLHLREGNYFSDIVISSVKRTTTQESPSSVNALLKNTIPGSTAVKQGNNEALSKTASADGKTQPTLPAFVCFNFNISMCLKTGI